MNAVKLVTVFGENRLGWMARITRALADAGVNIRWITIATSGTFGVIKLLVDKSDDAVRALQKGGFPVSLLDVLAVEVADKPGALHAITELLAKHRINVENSSGFVTQTHQKAVLLLEVTDLDHARESLTRHGLHLLSQEEVLVI
jgi:hypothetical protein